MQGITGIEVKTSNDPRLSIMQGARVLMGLSSSERMFVKKEEFEEHGVESIMHKLFPF